VKTRGGVSLLDGGWRAGRADTTGYLRRCFLAITGNRSAIKFCVTATALVSIYCGVAEAGSKPRSRLEPIRPVQIDVEPIPSFHRVGDADRRIGKLVWRGGLVLRSPARAFGGYSGIEISEDGLSLLAVSDRGTWLSARMRYRGNHLEGLDDANIGPLRGRNGVPLRRHRDQDAEALRLVSGTLHSGRALVAFERNHRIGLFRIQDGQLREPLSYVRPPMRLPFNKGIEAVALLHGGRYKGSMVAFAERFIDPNGHHRGWIWIGGKAQPIALTNEDEFDITDAVGLPDGGLIVLERRFRWYEGVQMRLRMIEPTMVRPSAVLSGITLLRADMRYHIDNMEGVALHRDKVGKLVLTVISDDNFNPALQRTLLMQFELPDR
jgi:hypothetical protein